jgi:TrpR family trp operon transcriptional repressor
MTRTAKKTLCSLITSLKTCNEAEELLGALLTPDELHTLAERWHIITLLLSGKTQREVQKQLGVGIATVTRGAKELKYGNGAFQKFAKRVSAKHRTQSRTV